jgi:hypothetical protein
LNVRHARPPNGDHRTVATGRGGRSCVLLQADTKSDERKSQRQQRCATIVDRGTSSEAINVWGRAQVARVQRPVAGFLEQARRSEAQQCIRPSGAIRLETPAILRRPSPSSSRARIWRTLAQVLWDPAEHKWLAVHLAVHLSLA